jgi:Fe2+ or Zn2+ uptake regulation protein
MAKAKKRGGEKAHRERLKKRNLKLTSEQNAIQKLFNESMKMQIEALKNKQESETGTTTNVQ